MNKQKKNKAKFNAAYGDKYGRRDVGAKKDERKIRRSSVEARHQAQFEFVERRRAAWPWHGPPGTSYMKQRLVAH